MHGDGIVFVMLKVREMPNAQKELRFLSVI